MNMFYLGLAPMIYVQDNVEDREPSITSAWRRCSIALKNSAFLSQLILVVNVRNFAKAIIGT